MSDNTILLTGLERDAYIAERFAVTELEAESSDAEDIMQAESDFRQRVCELFDIEATPQLDILIKELEGYGIETEEQIDDAYSGCYPSESAFCEDMLCDVYSEVIDAMPIFLQTAIDWEAVWYQSMRHDYTAIYFDGDYYFFNRNF